MADQVNVTAQVTYQNNLEMQLQQTKSQLEATVEVQDATGEAQAVRDIIGNALAQKADERHGDLRETNTPQDRVWLPKPIEQYFMKYLDSADQLATAIDLTGGYTMAGLATINRVWDSQILTGAYGPIISGKTVGATTTVFPQGQIIPVTTGGAAGPQHMNIEKIKAANLLLRQGFVDMMEPRFIVLSGVQTNDLLSEAQATSGDYAKAFGVKVDDAGNLIGILGFAIVPMELRNPFLQAYLDGLTVDANGYTKNPFWTKSGIRMGVWRKLRTAIKDQPSKVDTKSIFAGTTVAATRTQAGKVGIILNSEA